MGPDGHAEWKHEAEVQLDPSPPQPGAQHHPGSLGNTFGFTATANVLNGKVASRATETELPTIESDSEIGTREPAADEETGATVPDAPTVGRRRP